MKKDFEMPARSQLIRELIEGYKKRITQNRLKDEVYKWELVAEYKNRPDLQVNDFAQEMKSIDYSNLVYGIAQSVIRQIAREKPDELKIEFKNLFDESLDLADRIKSFNENTLKLYRSIGEQNSHHQDERSISAYLTYYYPDKYTFYKNSYYEKYCKLLGIKNASKGKKYIHYLGLIKELIDQYISQDQKLIYLVRSLIPDYYDGNNHNILAQDILYQMLDQKEIGDAEVEKISFEEVKSKFSDNIFEIYIRNLRKFTKDLGIQYGDKRVVYSVRKDRLNFTIGQRYCFNLFLSDDKRFGVISKERLLDDSEPFDGVQPVPYYNRYRDFYPTKSEYNSMISAMKYELKRTNNSGYYRFNNTEFENYIFNMKKENSLPLNMILYGPPGTGKTYNTINKAIEIIDGIAFADREEAKRRFDELQEEGQIEFVTFHQSYGYEEFIEGIKVIPPGEKGNKSGQSLVYKVMSGVFKKISETAKENYLDSKKTEEEIKKEYSLKNNAEEFLTEASEGHREFKKKQQGTFKILEYDDESIIVISQDSQFSNEKIILDFNEFIKILETEESFKTSKELAQKVFGKTHQRQRDTYYLSLYNAYKVYIEGKKSSNDVTTTFDTSLKNYILIIDEINRGNISKIFGELITLIEPDKRIGSDEELYVTLPYSGEKFGVPMNLYIIGTMNTADRSIALLDTALRRRFEFVEMMPKPELLTGIEIEGIDIEQLLKTMNQRIEYLYDRDHMIGHSFFMGLDGNSTLNDLSGIFRNKIIPLLQEYFYDDWEKIRLVLADNQSSSEEHQFVVIKSGYDAGKLFGDNIEEIEFDDDEKRVYEINSDAFEKIESYTKIYR